MMYELQTMFKEVVTFKIFGNLHGKVKQNRLRMFQVSKHFDSEKWTSLALKMVFSMSFLILLILK